MNIKRVKVLAIVLIVVGGIGSLLTYRFYEPTTLAVTKELEDAHINTIEIDANNEKVEIIPTTDPTPKVELTGKENEHTKSELIVEENDQTLSIQTENKMRKWFNFNFFQLSRTLTVYLPEKEYERLEVDVRNGKIQANDLVIHDVKVTSNNGKVELGNIIADSYDLRTSNGKIDLENLDGELKVKANNGKISLVTEDLDRNMDLETHNGKIDIQTENEPTNVIFDTSVNNGRVKLFGDDDYNKVIGDGDNIIRLRTNNGSITVTQ
ncbi:DUF4097 family beta strand repeat-containing protein [Piscibacillus halophilus]|uniref:Putative adhesin n=1 Tax=Piscibacillus halophilus TaxID=571933 RepID=A0A1H9D1G2_9BACI|nr:DUF4097 family beta strand repeat-containing protein [Piscibacillus halophilus]SEQ06598.1 Putative adhesin [Piscibacillus halophilus]